MGWFEDTKDWVFRVVIWFVIAPCLHFARFWPFSAIKQRLAGNMRKPGDGVDRYVMTKILEAANARDESLAVERSNIQPTDLVLEVGFGPGLGVKQAASLIDKSQGGHVYGVDYSQSMVDVASSRLETEIKNSLVDLQYGSVAELPYDSNTFDKIFHCNVFYFWDDCVGCCRELHRVLKPGGLMITTLEICAVAKSVSIGLLNRENGDTNNYMSALKSAGFVDVEMKEEKVGGDLYGCISARASFQ